MRRRTECELGSCSLPISVLLLTWSGRPPAGRPPASQATRRGSPATSFRAPQRMADSDCPTDVADRTSRFLEEELLIGRRPLPEFATARRSPPLLTWSFGPALADWLALADLLTAPLPLVTLMHEGGG